MRVKAPGLSAGKSGGYRLIYDRAQVDQSWHFVLLTLYFKGDCADLEPAQYRELKREAEHILGNVFDHAWEVCGSQ